MAFPNIQPQLLEIKAKESQVRKERHEYARVLSRLAALDVSDATTAMFQRFVNRELTIEDLDAAIDRHVTGRASSPSGPTT